MATTWFIYIYRVLLFSYPFNAFSLGSSHSFLWFLQTRQCTHVLGPVLFPLFCGEKSHWVRSS